MNRKAAFFVLTLIFMTSVIWPGWALSATVPETSPDKGLVIFYRPKKFSGSAIRFNVYHAEGSLGVLNSGTMVYGYFEPGQRQFWSQVISQDSITIDVKAGNVYFIKGDAKMGVYAGRPKFKEVDEATGRAEVGKL
mgnify:CR=1 FL=1